MPDFEFGCLPTAIGSMPHTDAKKACAQVTRYLKDVPVWPQLPKRSFLEDMNAQFSEGFPGVEVKEDAIHFERTQDFDRQLEALYTASLKNDFDKYPVSPDHAAGLHEFLAMDNLSPVAVKGQVTGPVTWGANITDKDKKAIIHDDTLADAAARFLRLKAGWEETKLRKLSKNTIIFVDEPMMASFGSAYFTVPKEKVTKLLEEVLGGISGVKGIHCCGNTDWPVLLGTSIDVLSFDAYNYAQSLSLYPAEVKHFLSRKGAIAWGIVPNEVDALAKETVSTLKDRLEEVMAPFTREGLHFKDLVQQSLLTPSCGLAALTEETAARALELLAGLSDAMRRRYA